MKKINIIFLITTLLLLTSCTNTVKEDEEKINIVTSFYPMYIATLNIIDGVEDVTLTNLTENTTGCLHDYQLSTKDMITLENADIFVINGGGMESFIEKAVETYPKIKIINASQNIYEEQETTNEKEHHENSHYWVSISLYIEQIQTICNELVENDSKNATKYKENTENYIEQLEKIKDEMHKELDNISEKNIVTFHEAFEYFAEEFNLNIVTVIEREPGTNPSAGEIAQIIETIKDKNAKAIFVEPQYSKTAADTISKETNIPIYILDPIVTGELNKEAYEQIMKENIENLKEALK